MKTDKKIVIRNISEHDCIGIEDAFNAQGWNKPAKKYEKYLKEQNMGKRDVLLAEVNSDLAGYLTIVWETLYSPFREARIPKIIDFNVLIKYQQMGVGTKLIEEAERRISKRSHLVGIGIGLTSDYGSAQRLYVKRGYIPDGKGIFQKDRYLKYSDKITVDDDLVIYFTKELSKPNNTYQKQ